MSLQHVIQQQQATARGAVVTGAERERGLYLDGDFVGRHLCAIMPAMHDKPAGAHRDQFLQRRLDPIRGFDDVETDSRCGLRAGRGTYEFADRRLIRRIAKMHADVPAPPAPSNADIAGCPRKTLGQQIDHLLCSLFVADRKSRAVRAWGDRQSE